MLAVLTILGLVNERQKRKLEEAQWEAVKLVKIGNWSGATDARTKAFNLLQSMSGLATLYDFTQKKPYQTSIPNDFLNKDEVKKALGVNESIVIHECSKDVRAALHENVMNND
ncbi:hypothetical protein CRYUN_Cryun04dG0169600 [Craigia yunnanensis]